MIYLMSYVVWTQIIFNLETFHKFWELIVLWPKVEYKPCYLEKNDSWKDKKTKIMVLPGFDRLLNLSDVFLSLYAFRTSTIHNIFIRNILDSWQWLLGTYTSVSFQGCNVQLIFFRLRYVEVKKIILHSEKICRNMVLKTL